MASNNFLILSAKSKSVLNLVCNCFAAELNVVTLRSVRLLGSVSQEEFGAQELT